MRRALALAARGLGETNPNPAVGCVVVRGGRVVGEGFHAAGRRARTPRSSRCGRPGARARGATLYVTLEPCAHHGRTPPCAPLVRDAGVARVVAALRDPNPLVRGRGLALLRRAGRRGRRRASSRPRPRGSTSASCAWARLGRPFVLLKAALTLDGRIATASGRLEVDHEPRRSAAQARWLRRLHDAVLVGIGTALADDPLLLPAPRTRRPFTRVVLDSRLRLPSRGRLVRTASARARPCSCSRCGAGRRRAGARSRRPGVDGRRRWRRSSGRVSLPAAARGAPRARASRA